MLLFFFQKAKKKQKMTKRLGWGEIEKHNSSNDAWIVIANKVYDVTTWLDNHPGGWQVLLDFAGKDATEAHQGTHTHTLTHTVNLSILT